MNNNNLSNALVPIDNWYNDIYKEYFTGIINQISKTKGLPEINEKLSEQFELLKKIDFITCDGDHSGQKSENGINYYQPKFNCTIGFSNPNRYHDIIPFDYNLTIEKPYLNCSTVQLKSTYYVCSVPLCEQIPTFWEMVYKIKSPNIVILTKPEEILFVENNCYWPKNLSETELYGSLFVTYTKMEEFGDSIIKRTFTIKVNDEERVVNHWHYTRWSDQNGIEAKDLHSFIKKINDSMEDPTSSFVVHSRKGLGRGSCFVAAWELLLQPSNERSLIQTVANLKLQRAKMIPECHQYKLVCDTAIYAENQNQ